MYNGLSVSLAVCVAGDEHKFRAAGPMARSDLTTTQYWGGAFRYLQPDGSTLADIVRGTLGIDLPDFPAAGIYTLRAMEDGARYFCVTAPGRKRTHKQRIDLTAGQQTVIKKGRVAIIDDGANLRIIVTKKKNARIDGPCKGLEVWV